MKYKNPKYRKRRNTFPLEVSCGNCKKPMVIYEKGGKGNLVKMQVPRIIESDVNLEGYEGHLLCSNCKEELARKGTYNENITYWIIRGKVNTKRLTNYF
ncbi:conserved hypothetical protein [Desulfonispora thiosulfatigenes DSM 11270]|uniref:Uncharacterized protein n=1 Tax=Desulfonispora thiosulfatigenes DSM 11270 TaxID=656914 RepID=A0A1W1VDS8_DESTI|nr:hypothetical protein [Desulfonispora thiosulfatigenes]SMB91528.1 conserved hypothetical protein [Desulfonispora thiosulfatigenes DSM 11270]